MIDGKHGFVMMTQNMWWQEFLRKKCLGMQTQSYVRSGSAAPKDTSVILFYVTKPTGEMAGYADFIERKVGEAEEVWRSHGHESILNTRAQYEEFIKEKQAVTFVRFRNLQVATNPVSLNEALVLLGKKRLSRTGFYMDKENTDKLIRLME